MALVALEDPGLAVFGYHRLLSNLGEPGPREALRDAILAAFEVDEVPFERLDPAGEQGIGIFGYIDAHHRRGFRLRLKDPPPRGGDARRLRGPPHARRGDPRDAASAGRARDELEDIEAKRGIGYTASAERALASLDEGGHTRCS